MDYPPWLPTPENTHAGRVLAVARCIHDRFFREDMYGVEGTITTFDTSCSGDLQRAADVLQRAGFITFIDDISRRSSFICEPSAFDTIARGREASAVDPELVKDAVIRLAQRSPYSNEITFLARALQRDGA